MPQGLVVLQAFTHLMGNWPSPPPLDLLTASPSHELLQMTGIALLEISGSD